MVDEAVKTARDDERRQARLAAGRASTIKTSTDLEDEDPNTAQRNLLG
jgi:hypothetical protein